MSKLQMFSGLVVDFDDPRPESIDPSDIAKSLSRICRFGGRTVVPYTVTMHAFLVSDIVLEATGDFQLALAGLHHDDHEAYIGDIITPLKEQLKGAAEGVATRLDLAIGNRLGIPVDALHHPAVKKADYEALWIERDHLLPNATEDVWGPHPEITTSRTVRLTPVSESAFLLRDAYLREIA